MQTQLETISHYRVIKKLGAGGMGEVYLAKDTELHRKVAIKLLPQRLASDGQFQRRFLREARAAARLEHPNICSVYEIGVQEGTSFIVMQYVEGETLADRIRRKPFELVEVFDIAAQVVDALAEAHSQGIIHRDMKPHNVMLTPKGKVKVVDFGLAKSIQPEQVNIDEAETEIDLTSSGVVLGSVPYMSPEQIRSEPLDGRSDLFSFGAMLYEMVSGRHPFRNDTPTATIAAILMRDPPPLKQLRPEAPAELERVVSKALCKDREGRYQSAEDLLDDIVKLQHWIKSIDATQPADGDEAPTLLVSNLKISSVESLSTEQRNSLVGRLRRKHYLALAVFLLIVSSAFGIILSKKNPSSNPAVPAVNQAPSTEQSPQPNNSNRPEPQQVGSSTKEEDKATRNSAQKKESQKRLRNEADKRGILDRIIDTAEKVKKMPRASNSNRN